MKVCAKRIRSEMFNILVHVSFSTTYVNSQLQNYSDAKGGAMQWSPVCELWSTRLKQSYNRATKHFI